MEFGPHPDLSWSRSRHDTLSICPRRYYYHYYGSWRGWDRDASDAEARRAYLLKQLTGLRAELGRSLHRRAYEVGFRVAQGLEPPGLDELLDRTRGELNEVVLSSRDREGFRHRPSRHPFLRSSWYGGGPSQEEIAETKDRMQRAHENLHGHGLWSAVDRGEVEVTYLHDPDVPPEPAFDLDGVPVYAEPDLVLRRAGDGDPVVVDWKSGRERGDDRWQLALAAVAVRESTGEAPRLGRVEYLATGGSASVELEGATLEEALRRARESLSEMEGCLEDPAENRAKPKAAFPLTERRSACGWCGFYELCEDELRARDGEAPPGPGSV